MPENCLPQTLERVEVAQELSEVAAQSTQKERWLSENWLSENL